MRPQRSKQDCLQIEFMYIYIYICILHTVHWLICFKQFDWFGGHRLSAHILVIGHIWKTLGDSNLVGKMAESKNSRFVSFAEVNK